MITNSHNSRGYRISSRRHWTQLSRIVCLSAVIAGSPVMAEESGNSGPAGALHTSSATVNSAQSGPVKEAWEFRVLLGDKDIGTHEFRVIRQGDREKVEISAQFDVKFLFFNAHSYSHQNLERWEGDCLEAIESVTDDNGTPYELRGMARDGRFTFEANPQGISNGPACIRSFAYWNPAFLDSRQLLNSQTGELVDVEITREGEDVLTIDDQPVPATRYEVQMAEGAISLWYGQETGQWLALEAPARGGRILRYEPISLPIAPHSDERLAFD